MAAILVGLVLLAFALAWIQRRPIATHYIDDALKARGVAARYRIERLGVEQQVLTDVVIGDPERPDLTARRAVVRLRYGFGLPAIQSIEADGVRLRGRLEGGVLRMGQVDRLLPPPSGKPFALPDLDTTLRDARMRLDTPAGPIGIGLTGEGNLVDGFRGRLAVATRGLAIGACRAEGLTAYLNLAVAKARPSIDGPLRAASLTCADASVRVSGFAGAVDATLSAALDRWTGDALFEIARIARRDLALSGLGGRIAFDGRASGTAGALSLTGERISGAWGRSGAIDFSGRYRLGSDLRLAGRIGARALSADPLRSRAIATAFAVGGGTPVGPIAAGIGSAAAAASRRIDLSADIALRIGKGDGLIHVGRADLRAASGARATLAGGQGLRFGWPGDRLLSDGTVTIGGGGLPDARLSLRQAAAGALIAGMAQVAPYAAGGARVALEPVRFDIAGGETRFASRITLDGPLADGRVDGLTLPLNGRLGRAGSTVVNPTCAPLTFSGMTVAGLRLGRSQLMLCPAGGGLFVRRADAAIGGGGRIATPRLAGTIGGSPATIAARSLGFTVGTPGFSIDALAVRLGRADAINRLDVAGLTGKLQAGGAVGRFSGLDGKLAAVPLLISEGTGDWRFDSGRLDLDGAIRVDDAADDPRFRPLVSERAHLTLVDGIVTATAPLAERETRTPLVALDLRHALASGRGHAVLDTPEIRFGQALQPEQLTRLTLGVVANVSGAVSGRGRIDWSPAGVASEGRYRTDGLDLAAAFGPVKGLKTELAFTDLLGLVTAPGQIATIAEANPGIAVNDGVVRYRLLRDQMVQVEDGRWPFSGGELILEPTLLDFGKPVERRFTFRVVGMDAAQFVQRFEFDNVAVTGTFDGVMPIIFDARGGRIEGGRLTVREAGGTLAYVGEVSNEDLGLFGSLAFDALKRMRYRSLAIELDGALDGELVSRVLFDGTNETPKEAVKKNGLLSQFSNLPFRFRITIRAPFRGLLNAAQSLNDPRGLIDQALPRQEPPLPGSAPVQPR
ncbi:YdbH domain-containing protein [Sphingomonas sp. 1P06PA]|uniref:intermembrane phospholipid transport protein YdbH family protein n=1 Tax=Sphingomonas sp. 1P06PA TaxID=554121 RepID=UPI0039A53D82